MRQGRKKSHQNRRDDDDDDDAEDLVSAGTSVPGSHEKLYHRLCSRPCRVAHVSDLSPADAILAVVAIFSNDLWQQHSTQMRTLKTEVVVATPEGGTLCTKPCVSQTIVVSFSKYNLSAISCTSLHYTWRFHGTAVVR